MRNSKNIQRMSHVFVILLASCMIYSCATPASDIKAAANRGDIDRLGQYISENHDIYDRIFALQVLSRFKNKKALEYILSSSKSGNSSMKKELIAALSKYSGYPEAKKALLDLAKDRSLEVKQQAFKAIALFPDFKRSEKIDIFKDGLKDNNKNIQLTAAIELRKLNDHSGGDVIFALLDEDYVFYRLEAAKEMQYYHNEKYIPKLKAFADDVDPEIRKYARIALNSHGINTQDKKEKKGSEPPEKKIVSKKELIKLKFNRPYYDGNIIYLDHKGAIDFTGNIKSDSKITYFTMNGIEINIDQNGDFSTNIYIPNEQKKIVVYAEDLFGSNITKTYFLGKSALDDRFRGKYYALVIGNNAYRQLPRLQTAEKDAEAVNEVLKNRYGFRTVLIINGTRHSILSALDKLRVNLSTNDNLLVYYAGHGYFDKGTERGYWLPVEANRETSADWISNADITDRLKAIKAKHIMIVADSCYSGTLARSIQLKSANNDYLSRILNKRSRTVLTSGGMEPVEDSGGGGHSVFAKFFVQVLKENEDFIDGTQMFSEIRRRVIANARQTPEYAAIRFAGDEGGDFVFLKKH